MDYELARNQMVELQLLQRGIRDERVLKAMRKVPRHLFVEPALRERAYGDYPLPIGEGQTISQPYMVGYMTQALDLAGTEKILEIGTGSGYQAAILAELAEQVFSIERIKSLALKARETLDSLGYRNVAIKIFDGSYGWAEQAPFDAILVTAGAPNIPPVFIDQLGEGGRLVIPVGGESYQVIHKVTKGVKGVRTQKFSNCVFVKLIGEHGWKE
ncbi:MAG: protein-L-isoaspartate(D-aspartate) O-methyltransferase [Candidatus Tectomicrobia bacterium]|uniref:Protein-L-isoaspartate O-methyltransferase n=1 Tax=Tectimicrobiota bacterium TaxID=2528274 RepID=A0A932GP29_UNCTE|nr:protein-L-isoaspartate(D-aspartate) O-methyltransferase [Candidatus Tectomicrobia bacterium]